ncbi:uncharacterized protein BCR38DRAFT_337534 [Pseudomassariella vexata]|uniref:Putative gamma-glutamylcyclotransferase n=1 Tax=Pseudomassariella vexata TaxID=1141098 RepID=A0A1Y2E7B9_9PEZI|nr:uncharacterized protein BCR38DRAFT_337534 [Pseudomassariella vexata]ORY67473.1 hypothetical protein BCR38DRAFT_337534 [Pseudomassariella vexata]
MAAKFTAADKTRTPALTQSTSRPRYFFFYGSLMDPEVYQTVTNSADPPVMQKGWITGFRMKMWGIYPALVPEAGSKITGTFCMVNSHDHFMDLQEYETGNYTPFECTIFTEGADQLDDSPTEGWAGSPASKELEGGVFDFERYQKYFKPSVVRGGF